MAIEQWGTWQQPIMDPRVLAILTSNRADIEAIIAKVGIGTLFELMPHFINILNTLNAQQKGSTK